MKFIRAVIIVILCLYFATAFVQLNQLKGYAEIAKIFYVYLISICLVICLVIILLNRKCKINISANYLDISIIIYCFYCTLRLMFTPGKALDSHTYVCSILLCVFYFISKAKFKNIDISKKSPAYMIIVAFLITGLCESMISLLQFYKVLDINSEGMFKVIGTFDNPAPLTGFIISSMPFALGIYFNTDAKTRYAKILKYLGLLNFIAGVTVLPLTISRSGWLAIFGGLAFLIITDKIYYYKIRSICNNMLKKLIMLIISVIIIVYASVLMYNLKPYSASGRYLTWKISLEMIKDNPLFGLGYNTFGEKYNYYQAKYFAETNRSEYERYIAGNIKVANNELVQITCELGIIGLLLFITIEIIVALNILKYYKNIKINISKNNTSMDIIGKSAFSSMIAIFIYSLFCYPFHVLPTFINVIFLLSIISSNFNYNKNLIIPAKISRPILIFMTFLLIIIIPIFTDNKITEYNNYLEWNKASAYSVGKDYKNAIKSYRQLYNNLKTNGTFILNYGGTLALAGKYYDALKILENGENICADPNLQLSMGKSYEAVGNYRMAESKYIQAMQMIPNMFYPKYLLANYYSKLGNYQKAKVVALDILQQRTKISSPAISEIKKEMEILLKQ